MSNTATAQVPVVVLNKELVTQQSFELLPLNDYGLKPEDFNEVILTAKELSNISTEAVSEFGKNINKNTSKYADELLELVQSKDVDVAGNQLNEVLSAAQTINLNNLVERPKSHRLPIIGGLLAKFSKSKQEFSNRFNTVRDHIEGLVTEIEKNQNGLKRRINMLDTMYVEVNDVYRQLGIHAISGQMVLSTLDDEIESAKAVANDPLSVQRVSDLNQIRQNLEKRIHDLKILQQSALQTMPMIRIIQSNNTALVEKFHTVKNITLPAWKNQISLAISLQEQKNSVALANSIDDATNDLLRRNADLLHQNSVDTARANQRSVIDIETLEHVQNKLIATVTDVIQIHNEGKQKRIEATDKIKALQNNLSHLVIEGAKK
jgi:uncharacterized protein YaaN involved in tellurite resistance